MDAERTRERRWRRRSNLEVEGFGVWVGSSLSGTLDADLSTDLKSNFFTDFKL